MADNISESLKRRRARGLKALRAWRATLTSAQLQQISRQRYARAMTRLRQQVTDVLGCVCVHCGFSDERALHIDHVTPVGKHHPDHHGGPAFYKRVLANPEQFQRLCANCNIIKSYDNGERAARVG